MNRWEPVAIVGLLVSALAAPTAARGGSGESGLITFRENGGWCWYQDERAIVDGDRLVFASVAGTNAHGWQGGDIVVTRYRLGSGERAHFELHDRLERDDHAAPALLELADGRYLAMYSTHWNDPFSRWRISKRPGRIGAWTKERTFRHPAGRPTYSNLFRLSRAGQGDGRLYNFTRTAGADPHAMVSGDGGRTWRLAGRLLDWPGRPYLKYASAGRDTVHFIATDGHPRDADNNIYHGYLRDGKVHTSRGEVVDTFDKRGLREKTLTRIFDGGPHRVAWTTDLHLDAEGRPVAGFSVQMDGASIRNSDEGPGWDHRYYYARWAEGEWHVHEMAYAGTGLYRKEADYTGLLAIDPADPSTVFISADVHPRTGLPNVSEADGERHYEIFRGVTDDRGASWRWSGVTENSDRDHLRPVIPKGGGDRRIVLWTRGTLRTYTDYDLNVVGLVERR